MFKKRRRNSGSLMAVVVIFLILGGMLLVASYQASQEAAHAEQLPVVTGKVLANTPPGREVIVEGRISSNMRPVYEDFVAYEEKHRQSDSEGGTRWVTEQMVTPPLLVETGDGRVQIEKDRTTSYYAVSRTTYTSTSASGDRHYSGFRIDDPIVALGMTRKGNEGMVVDAEFVYGGTWYGYVNHYRRNESTFRQISLIMFGLAAAAFVLLLVGRLLRLVTRNIS